MNVGRIITNPSIISANENREFGVFTLGVFAPGFAQTVGVALRRILLSSIPGCGISYVKINGILHKFCSLPNMKEDIIHFIENLKNIKFRIRSDAVKSSQFKVNLSMIVDNFPNQSHNAFVLTSGMIPVNPDVEILNDVYLCTIDLTKGDGIPFEFSFALERGYGYFDGKNNRNNLPHGAIVINNVFNSVRRVSIETEQTRHGEYNDYENLKIEVVTDGSITPRDALIMSRDILINQLDHIGNSHEKVHTSAIPGDDMISNSFQSEILVKSIRDIGMKDPVCSTLESNGVNTIGELINYSRDDLLKIPKLGQTKINHIEERLKVFGLHLNLRWES